MKACLSSKTMSPIANQEAVVCGEKYRITVLTSKLIRLEFSETGTFKDNATFCVVNRQFDVPEISVKDEGEFIKVQTEDVLIVYKKNCPFSQTTLNIYYTGDRRSIFSGRNLQNLRYGVEPFTNMKGTAIALDNVDGACELSNGIISQAEICILDDSKTRIFDENCNLIANTFEETDIYAFCYGDETGKKYDYEEALYNFYCLTGQQPLIPRYALGNWWSRYHVYTDQEYLELFDRFEKEQMPFSVGVMDMDWHLTAIDKKYGNGWTGCTWNKELFPDHVGFLKELHDRGLHTCLNLHPQGGVAPHEDGYELLAERLGVKKGEIVEFDPEDPDFLKEYFEIFYNRLEEEGVDFWWLDYNTELRQIDPDPLPVLNAYHYDDNTKENKRGLLLSRYAGPGSHRYPIGFSGDAVNSWESLEFQPYFTATASNIGFGWWSHDIGGFQRGIKDDNLMARWTQLGVFSPINRLHCTNFRYMSKEPWQYGEQCEKIMRRFLQLRHQLIPYLYTMNYRASEYGMPLVTPLYSQYGTNEAYQYKTEYFFGTELLVSPIVKPNDEKTNMGCADVYLPDGIYYDFFDGTRYCGGKTFRAYRTMEDIPVFAKAGAIVPMDKSFQNAAVNPKNMLVKVFAGADHQFSMYEDDGETFNYRNGEFVNTEMKLNWKNQPVFSLKYENKNQIVPENRTYTIEFTGVTDCDVTVTNCGEETGYTRTYKDGILTIELDGETTELMITLHSDALYSGNKEKKLDTFIKNAKIEYVLKEELYRMLTSEASEVRKLAFVEYHVSDEHVRQALVEILTSDR